MHESPQCQLSAKWSSGQAWHSVGVSAVQCRFTAVPGGHWSHIRTSEVTGSRYWYFGGMSCCWKAQDSEAVTSCKAEQEGGGVGGVRGWTMQRVILSAAPSSGGRFSNESHLSVQHFGFKFNFFSFLFFFFFFFSKKIIWSARQTKASSKSKFNKRSQL